MSKSAERIKFEKDLRDAEEMIFDHLGLMARQNDFSSQAIAAALEDVSIKFAQAAGYSRELIELTHKACLDFNFNEK